MAKQFIKINETEMKPQPVMVEVESNRTTQTKIHDHMLLQLKTEVQKYDPKDPEINVREIIRRLLPYKDTIEETLEQKISHECFDDETILSDYVESGSCTEDCSLVCRFFKKYNCKCHLSGNYGNYFNKAKVRFRVDIQSELYEQFSAWSGTKNFCSSFQMYLASRLSESFISVDGDEFVHHTILNSRLLKSEERGRTFTIKDIEFSFGETCSSNTMIISTHKIVSHEVVESRLFELSYMATSDANVMVNLKSLDNKGQLTKSQLISAEKEYLFGKNVMINPARPLEDQAKLDVVENKFMIKVGYTEGPKKTGYVKRTALLTKKYKETPVPNRFLIFIMLLLSLCGTTYGTLVTLSRPSFLNHPGYNCFHDSRDNLNEDLDFVTYSYDGSFYSFDMEDYPPCDLNTKGLRPYETSALLTSITSSPFCISCSSSFPVGSPAKNYVAANEPLSITSDLQLPHPNCSGYPLIDGVLGSDTLNYFDNLTHFYFAIDTSTLNDWPYSAGDDLCHDQCIEGIASNLTCYSASNICGSTSSYCDWYLNTYGLSCVNTTGDCLVRENWFVRGLGAEGSTESDGLQTSQFQFYNILMNNETGRADNDQEILITLALYGAYSLPTVIKDPDFNVEITRNDGVIYFRVNLPFSGNLTVIIRKRNVNEVLLLSEQFTVWPIPSRYLRDSGTMMITAFKGSDIVGTASFYVVAIHGCNVYDCTVCWEAYYNFGCLPLITRIFLITILIILLCAACWLFPAVATFSLRTLKYLFYCFGGVSICCWNMSKIPMWRSLKSKVFSLNQKMKDNMMPDYELVETEIPMDEGLGSKFEESTKKFMKYDAITGKPIRNSELNILSFGVNHTVMKLQSFSLLILIILGLCKACDSGALIPVELKDCVKKNKMEECTLDLSLTGIISHVGGSSCFTMKDDLDVLAEIQVTYLALEARTDLVTEYWTSSYDLSYESKHVCRDTAFSSSKCHPSTCSNAEANPSDRRGDNSLVKETVVNYPGQSGCKSGNGGWDNQCLSYKGTCVFYGWGINPMGEIFEVSKPGGTVVTPFVQIDIESSGVKTTRYLSIQGNSLLSDHLKFTVVGELETPNIELSEGQKFLRKNSDNTLSVVTSAIKNIPSGFTYGAIQATSPNGFLNPSPTSFIYSDDIVQSVTLLGKHVQVTFQKFQGQTFYSLPAQIDGNYWVSDSHKIMSNLTSPGALVFNLDTVGGLLISRELSLICPRVTKATAKGCYDCDEGAEMLITASSTCDMGLALLTVSDPEISLFTNSISLETNNKEFLIRFSTTRIMNSFTVTIVGTSDNATIDVEFVAYSGVTLVNQTVSGGNGTIHTSSGSKFKFDDWLTRAFSGFGKWWHSLIVYFIVFILIIVALITIYYGVMYYAMKLKNLKKKN